MEDRFQRSPPSTVTMDTAASGADLTGARRIQRTSVSSGEGVSEPSGGDASYDYEMVTTPEAGSNVVVDDAPLQNQLQKNKECEDRFLTSPVKDH